MRLQKKNKKKQRCKQGFTFLVDKDIWYFQNIFGHRENQKVQRDAQKQTEGVVML